MRILINAVSAKMGGAASYVKNLAGELAKLDLQQEFIFCVPEEQAQAIRGLASNIRVISTEVAHGSFLKRLWFDQITLRQIIKREKVDLIYSTANIGVFACPCAQVLLVRNSLHFSNLYLTHILPHKGWRVRLDDALRRWLICQSVKWADAVMTPSQSMLDELRGFVKEPASKFVVNPYGTILDRFQADSEVQPGEGTNGLKRRARLLHISHYADHKNLGVLFEALEILSKSEGFDVTLSTTADVEDSRYPASYCRAGDRALLQRAAIGQRVIKLGDVAQHKLAQLYRQHDAFVFPSLSESYGHPLVEAMACKLPVIAADTPVSRELCGDAALYFDPFSAEDLALKISELFADDVLQKQLGDRGLLRVQSADLSSHVERLLHTFSTTGTSKGKRAAKTMTKSNSVYVTHLDHDTAHESFTRLIDRYSSSLARDCRTISIKVNLCDYRKAASGATTDPVLLDALLEVLKIRYPEAQLYILENDATTVEAHSLFSLLGIKQIADKHGAQLFNVAEGDWVLKKIPKGNVFHELEVPEILERSDLFINFPKLKTNSLTKTTGNLKNIFAFLRTKHKSVYHPRIDDVLVDMNQVIHPHLCIVDGFIGMEGQGPAFGRPKKCGLLIGGVDPVAVDACCARIMGFNPWFIDHIRRCYRVGVGNIRFHLDTDISGFDFSKYRFDYSRIEHAARTFLRKRVGVSG